ncbi:MAG: hypothetical protein WDO12_08880 [Pseudomonadota bacterium]
MKRTLLIALLTAVSSAVRSAPPDLDAAVEKWASADLKPTYTYALTDLNADGYLDAVVLISDPDYCGSGGCSMVVFKGTPDGFEVLSESTITREPIFVLPEVKSGWHSISVFVAGGGAEPGQVLLRFDGKGYPGNPTTEEYATKADLKLAQQLSLK